MGIVAIDIPRLPVSLVVRTPAQPVRANFVLGRRTPSNQGGYGALRTGEKARDSRALSDNRATPRHLRRDELAGLANDHFSAGDLRWARECRLELLLAHPGGRDTRRLLGVSLSVEDADRSKDAVTGL